MPPKDNQVIIDALKSKYFELCKDERIGSNPEMTQAIDNLEQAIRELIKKDKAAQEKKAKSGK